MDVRAIALVKMVGSRVSVMVGVCMVVGSRMVAEIIHKDILVVVGSYMMVGSRGLSRSRRMDCMRASGDVLVAMVLDSPINVLLSMSLSMNMLLDKLVRLG
jgi:hypothetical protein